MKNGKRRSFSLANAPHDDELLQLHVRNYRGGTFAEHVFTQMKERDILRFEGPLGTFFLREDSDKPIIFVASGTGFAPVKSILEHVFHVRNSSGNERQMVLYWGTGPRQIFTSQTSRATGNRNMTTSPLFRCYPRHCHRITGAEEPGWCMRP